MTTNEMIQKCYEMLDLNAKEIEEIKDKLDDIESRLDSLDARLDDFSNDLGKVGSSVSPIEMKKRISYDVGNSFKGVFHLDYSDYKISVEQGFSIPLVRLVDGLGNVYCAIWYNKHKQVYCYGNFLEDYAMYAPNQGIANTYIINAKRFFSIADAKLKIERVRR